MTTLTALMNAHIAALAAYDALNDDEWKLIGVDLGKAVDTTRDAILEHRPSSMGEIRAKSAFMLSYRTFTEWDDYERTQLIEALTPAPCAAAGNDLGKLIDACLAAKATWDATNEVQKDITDRPEWDAYEEAEHAVLIYPCLTIEDVRIKAQFFLGNESPYDTLRNCSTATEEALLPFLRSLAGAATI